MNYLYAAIGFILLIAVGVACRFSYTSGIHAQEATDQAATIKAETVARQAQADADKATQAQLQAALADAQTSAVDRQNRLTALQASNSALQVKLHAYTSQADTAWLNGRIPDNIRCGMFGGPGCAPASP